MQELAVKKAKKLITYDLQMRHAKLYMKMIVYRCTKFTKKL